MTRDELTDTLTKAIHDDGCGPDEELSNDVGCGALDMHTSEAIAVIAELQGLGIIRLGEDDRILHLGDTLTEWERLP